MFCQHFVAFLSDFVRSRPKVPAVRAHAPDQPAMTAAMITRRPMGIVSFLRSKVGWIFHLLGKNDQKRRPFERIAVFYYFLCETVMFLYGRYRSFLGKKKQCTLMILLNLPLRFHGGTFSDFNIAHNFSLTDKSTQSSGIYTYHKYNQKNTCEKKWTKRLVELVSYSAKETVEDKEQGDQAHHRLLCNLQHLRKSQEHEANAHHGSIESCGWSNFTNAFSKERTKHPAGVVFPWLKPWKTYLLLVLLPIVHPGFHISLAECT